MGWNGLRAKRGSARKNSLPPSTRRTPRFRKCCSRRTQRSRGLALALGRLGRPSRGLCDSRPEADPDYVHQLVVVGGLLEKCRGAGLEGFFFVVLRIAGAQYDYRNPGKGVAVLQAVEDNETVADGQAQVQNDQRRALFLGGGDGGVAIAGGGYIVVVGAQTQPSGRAEGRGHHRLQESSVLALEFSLIGFVLVGIWFVLCGE